MLNPSLHNNNNKNTNGTDDNNENKNDIDNDNIANVTTSSNNINNSNNNNNDNIGHGNDVNRDHNDSNNTSYTAIKGFSSSVGQQRFDPISTTSQSSTMGESGVDKNIGSNNESNNNFLLVNNGLQNNMEMMQQQQLNQNIDIGALQAMNNNAVLQRLLIEQLQQQTLFDNTTNNNGLTYLPMINDPVYQNYFQNFSFGLNNLGMLTGLPTVTGISTTGFQQYPISNQMQTSLLSSLKQQQMFADQKTHPNQKHYPYSLFVFHLPPDVDNNGLLQLFLPYNATSCHVMRNGDGSSRGFGFVYFVSQQDATVARDTMNGYQVGSKRLKVSFKRGQNDSQATTDVTNSNTNTNTNS